MAVLHVPVKLRESGKILVTESREQVRIRLSHSNSNDLVVFHEDVGENPDGNPKRLTREIEIKASLIQMVEDQDAAA